MKKYLLLIFVLLQITVSAQQLNNYGHFTDKNVVLNYKVELNNNEALIKIKHLSLKGNSLYQINNGT